MLFLETNAGKVRDLAFSPDGEVLASVHGNGVLHLWDLREAKSVQEVQSAYRIASVAFCPGERPMLGYCDTQGILSTYDWVAGGHCAFQQRLDPIPNVPCKFAFSPDGTILALTGSFTRGIGWRVGTGIWELSQSAGTFPITFLSRGANTSLAFTPGGDYLITGGREKWLSLWDCTKWLEPVHQLNHGHKVHFITCAPDDSTLASATLHGFVRIWDMETGRKKKLLHNDGSHVLQALCYSPDGTMLATAESRGLVHFWDLDAGEVIRTFDWEVGPVECVAFSADGMRAAAGGAKGVVIWDIDLDEW